MSVFILLCSTLVALLKVKCEATENEQSHYICAITNESPEALAICIPSLNTVCMDPLKYFELGQSEEFDKLKLVTRIPEVCLCRSYENQSQCAIDKNICIWRDQSCRHRDVTGEEQVLITYFRDYIDLNRPPICSGEFTESTASSCTEMYIATVDPPVSAAPTDSGGGPDSSTSLTSPFPEEQDGFMRPSTTVPILGNGDVSSGNSGAQDEAGGSGNDISVWLPISIASGVLFFCCAWGIVYFGKKRKYRLGSSSRACASRSKAGSSRLTSASALNMRESTHPDTPDSSPPHPSTRLYDAGSPAMNLPSGAIPRVRATSMNSMTPRKPTQGSVEGGQCPGVTPSAVRSMSASPQMIARVLEVQMRMSERELASRREPILDG